MNNSFTKGLLAGVGVGLAAGAAIAIGVVGLVKCIDESVFPGIRYDGGDDDVDDIGSIFDDGTYDEFEDLEDEFEDLEDEEKLEEEFEDPEDDGVDTAIL